MKVCTFQSQHEQLDYNMSVSSISPRDDMSRLTGAVVLLVCLLVVARRVCFDCLFDRLNGAAQEVRVTHGDSRYYAVFSNCGRSRSLNCLSWVNTARVACGYAGQSAVVCIGLVNTLWSVRFRQKEELESSEQMWLEGSVYTCGRGFQG